LTSPQESSRKHEKTCKESGFQDQEERVAYVDSKVQIKGARERWQDHKRKKPLPYGRRNSKKKKGGEVPRVREKDHKDKRNSDNKRSRINRGGTGKRKMKRWKKGHIKQRKSEVKGRIKKKKSEKA